MAVLEKKTMISNPKQRYKVLHRRQYLATSCDYEREYGILRHTNPHTSLLSEQRSSPHAYQQAPTPLPKGAPNHTTRSEPMNMIYDTHTEQRKNDTEMKIVTPNSNQR